MSLEMKAARLAAGHQQGLSWGAVTGALGKGAGWLAGVLGQGGQQQPMVRRPGLLGAMQRITPGGATGFIPGQMPGQPPIQGQMMLQEPGMVIACPKGYRPNKTSYFLKDGTRIEKGTKCVKNRRRNSLNPKAASRAMARLEGAKRAAKDLNRVTIRPRKCK